MSKKIPDWSKHRKPGKDRWKCECGGDDFWIYDDGIIVCTTCQVTEEKHV